EGSNPSGLTIMEKVGGDKKKVTPYWGAGHLKPPGRKPPEEVLEELASFIESEFTDSEARARDLELSGMPKELVEAAVEHVKGGQKGQGRQSG
ncbi:TPA: hypothetical protein DEB02_02685, partial [Candidatus Beckwithbacteria bacterium]|nr:hypothetical protein [Candidatus Beckwithbacteria bacterium]